MSGSTKDTIASGVTASCNNSGITSLPATILGKPTCFTLTTILPIPYVMGDTRYNNTVGNSIIAVSNVAVPDAARHTSQICIKSYVWSSVIVTGTL